MDRHQAANEEALSEACHVQVQVVDHAGPPNAERGAVCPLVDLGLSQPALPPDQQALVYVYRLPACMVMHIRHFDTILRVKL